VTSHGLYNHVHIGAGSFGLGMVLPICQSAGFSTVVLNRQSAKPHHHLLQKNGTYMLRYDNDPATDDQVRIAIRYYATDHDEAVLEILSSRSIILITTSIKADNFTHFAPILAKAIERRREQNLGPICVMACENLRNNSKSLENAVVQRLSEECAAYTRSNIHFCNTVVDRVCTSIRLSQDSVQVHAESFSQWIVDKPPYELAAIIKLSSTDAVTIATDDREFAAYETQKYWCLNGMHLAVAAYGFIYDPSLRYVSDIFGIRRLSDKVQALSRDFEKAFVLYVAEKGLSERFPKARIREYCDFVIKRFRNNRADTLGRILKQSQVSPVAAILPLVRGILKIAEGDPDSNASHSTERNKRRLLNELHQNLPNILWLLDTHEVLDRAIQRFIEPLCMILRLHKDLVATPHHMVLFHKDRKPTPRTQLDDAILAVVLATAKYAQQQYEMVQRDLNDLLLHGRL
jgi:hypothetical protein